MSHADKAACSGKPLPTVWEVPGPLWEKIVAPVLSEFDPPKKKGRPRADPRRCLDGIIYRARTGCQWNRLPREFGDDATVHRTLQRWERQGVFDRIWALLLYHCEELGAVHWQWQAADGCLNKARFIGKRGRPTPPHKGQETKGTQTPERRTQRAGSARTQPTAGSWASKTACLSREEAARLLCASPART
jgi:transposase